MTANVFYLYSGSAPGLAPFYRCYNSSLGVHFYTTDIACEVWPDDSLEGRLGYVATSSVSGSVPLYRSYQSSNADHFYTTSLTEHNAAVAAGHLSEGVVGYVFTSPR